MKILFLSLAVIAAVPAHAACADEKYSYKVESTDVDSDSPVSLRFHEIEKHCSYNSYRENSEGDMLYPVPGIEVGLTDGMHANMYIELPLYLRDGRFNRDDPYTVYAGIKFKF